MVSTIQISMSIINENLVSARELDLYIYIFEYNKSGSAHSFSYQKSEQ